MTVLDQTTAALELADLWDQHAAAQTRYDPDDPKAKVLARCAADLREIVGRKAPEWLPLRIVHATTGQSLAKLRERCEEIEHRGGARRVSGRWEMSIQEAMQVPRKAERIDVSQVTDIDELARILGRDPGTE